MIISVNKYWLIDTKDMKSYFTTEPENDSGEFFGGDSYPSFDKIPEYKKIDGNLYLIQTGKEEYMVDCYLYFKEYFYIAKYIDYDIFISLKREEKIDSIL